MLNTLLLRHGTVLLTGKSVVQKSFFEFANVNGATSFAGVPYTYELLEKSGHLQKDNSIQKYTQAGGRLSLNLRDKFAKYCKENDKTFTIMYGQTEATARMTVLPWQEIERKRGSAGKVICGGKLWIDDGLHNEVEGVIRPSVGVIGVIIMSVIVAKPLLTLLAVKLAVWIGATINDIFDISNSGGLLKSINSVLSIGVSILAAYSIMFVISTSVVIMTAMNTGA